jgi:hypothetical protein
MTGAQVIGAHIAAREQGQDSQAQEGLIECLES